MGVFRSVGVRVVMMEPGAEVACIAVSAAILGYAQQVMKQELRNAVPSGSVE